MNEKLWVLRRKDRTTVVFRVLNGEQLAVARAYLSTEDRLDKKKGVKIATGRLDKYLGVYKALGTRNRPDRGNQRNIFEVIRPEELHPEELDFFQKVVKKRD